MVCRQPLKKDPSILPVVLRYFTHKNLLEEAKSDLYKINQKLQDTMNEELKKLQKALATNSEEIAETSSKIKEIELYKQDIEDLLSGKIVKINSYPLKYFSMLEDELIKVMEKKLTSYIKDDNDIERKYKRLNSRAKRLITLEYIGCLTIPILPIFSTLLALGSVFLIAHLLIGTSFFIPALFLCEGLAFILPFAVVFIVGSLLIGHYSRSFVKEMEDFMEMPKYIDKVTNTEEHCKESEQTVLEVEDLIDLSEGCHQNALDDQRSSLYPDLPKFFPEECAKVLDSRPRHSFDYTKVDSFNMVQR